MDQRDMDQLMSRRQSWTGATVQDCVPGSEMHGRYFRVTLSNRDPATDDWEIRWTKADEILKPTGEPIYRFDGTTWDLPAYPSTVFPRAWLWTTIGATTILSILVGIVSAPSERAGLTALMIGCGVVYFAFTWFAKTEPVRGTKVGAAASAALVAHHVHSRNEEQRRLEDQRQNPSMMVQYLRTQGVGPDRDVQTALQQQAQILANQQAIANRIGLILPPQHGRDWRG